MVVSPLGHGEGNIHGFVLHVQSYRPAWDTNSARRFKREANNVDLMFRYLAGEVASSTPYHTKAVRKKL